MCWALPELPVIAPGAKNSLPDKDAFLGAVGRILRGTSFILLDPQSALVWGGGSGDRSWGVKGPPGGCTSLVLLDLGHEGSRTSLCLPQPPPLLQTEHSDAQYGHRGLH